MAKGAVERNLKIAIAIVLVILIAGSIVFYFWVKPPELVTDTEIAEERADGVYNVLVVGVDKVGLNTDTIMVLSLDTKNDKANVLSIPRDTMSNVSRRVKKINAAYGVGGKANIDQLKTEVRYLLGFEVDYHVVVNLSAFEEIIDAIGGVTIDVPQNMNYEDPYQDLYIHIDKGMQTLNGKEAVGFVRYRKGYAEGDLGRVKAQQQFVEALATQLATPNTVSKLPKLANIVLQNMETDLNTGELVWFGTQALELNMAEDLSMFILPGEARMVSGLSYYIPDEEEILAIVNGHFNPYPNQIMQLNVVDRNSLPKTPVNVPATVEEQATIEDEELLEETEQEGEDGTDTDGEQLSPDGQPIENTDGTVSNQPNINEAVPPVIEEEQQQPTPAEGQDSGMLPPANGATTDGAVENVPPVPEGGAAAVPEEQSAQPPEEQEIVQP